MQHSIWILAPLTAIASLLASCVTPSTPSHPRASDATAGAPVSRDLALQCAEDLRHRRSDILLVACIIENPSDTPATLDPRRLVLHPDYRSIAIASPSDIQDLARTNLENPSADDVFASAFLLKMVRDPQLASQSPSTLPQVLPRYSPEHLLSGRSTIPPRGSIRRYLVMRTGQPEEFPRTLELCQGTDPKSCVSGPLDVSPDRSGLTH